MADIMILGLGGAGSSMAVQMYLPLKARVVLANTDAKSLAKYENSQCFLLGADRESLQKALTPSMKRKAVKESMPKLEAVIGNPELLVLVAGLGGVTGTESTITLAAWAKEHSIPVIVAATVPFSYEGGRRSIALRTVNDLDSLEIPTLAVDFADLEKSHGDKPMPEILDHAVQTLIYKIQEHRNEFRLHA